MADGDSVILPVRDIEELRHRINQVVRREGGRMGISANCIALRLRFRVVSRGRPNNLIGIICNQDPELEKVGRRTWRVKVLAR